MNSGFRGFPIDHVIGHLKKQLGYLGSEVTVPTEGALARSHEPSNYVRNRPSMPMRPLLPGRAGRSKL